MYRLGVDLGGTTISAGIIDDNYNIIFSDTISTTEIRNEDTAKIISEDIGKLSGKLINEFKSYAPESAVQAIGIGVPASVENNLIIDANNLGLINADIVSGITRITGLDVKLINDARAAALAEYYAGAGAGTKSLYMITLGTGIGGCFIYGGKVIEGCNNAAGEIGHMVIDINGRVCNCGRRGCFEDYASASALVSDAKAEDSSINNGKDFFAALKSGNKIAESVFNNYLDYLSCGVTNIINILQPDIIVIGGGISAVGDTLLFPLKERVSKLVYTQHSRIQTDLKIAKLNNTAGIIGAALSV